MPACGWFARLLCRLSARPCGLITHIHSLTCATRHHLERPFLQLRYVLARSVTHTLCCCTTVFALACANGALKVLHAWPCQQIAQSMKECG